MGSHHRFVSWIPGLLLIFALFGRLQAADQSNAFQINAAHTGGVESGSFPPNFATAWTADFGGSLSYPIIAGGKVFLAVGNATSGTDDYGTRLYALDLNTGAVLWGPVALPGTYFLNYLAYDGGRLFTVNFDGLLKAINPNTGAVLWSRQLVYFSSAPTARNGVVYVSGANGISAVNEATGGVIWESNLDGDGDSSTPTVTADGVYVAFAADNVFKLSLTTGKAIWSYPPIGDGGGSDTAPVYQGRLYTGPFSGNLILNAATGKSVGTTPSGVPPPIFGGGRMYLLNQGTLEARDLLGKSVQWSFAVSASDSILPPIYLDGYVLAAVATDELEPTPGTVFAVDAATGQQVWSAALPGGTYYDYGGTFPGLAAAEGHLLVPNGSKLSVFTYPDGPTTPLTPLLVKGQPVPAAGVAGSGIPAGAVWASFGVPALNDQGSVALLAGWAAKSVAGRGLFLGDQLLAAEGAPAGPDGVYLFKTLTDPLLDDLGDVAFLATLKGPSITAATAQTLWTNAWNGSLEMIAQTGVAAPAAASPAVPGAPAGVPAGAMFKKILSMALDGQTTGNATVAYVATLKTGAGGITSHTNLGLWVMNSGGTRLIVQTGDSLTVNAAPHVVKSIGALMVHAGSPGQGHGDAQGNVAVLLNFEDHLQAIGQYDGNTGAFTLIAANVGTDLTALNLPVQSADGTAAFRASTLDGRVIGSGLFEPGTAGALNELAAKGGSAGSIGKFAAFKDPVVNGSGDIAFSAALAGTKGGVADNQGLFWIHSGVLQLLAQMNAQPPGYGTGAHWASFTSIALPENGPGPFFTAKVTFSPNSPINPTAATLTHTGLWSSDASGNLTLLLCTGQFVPGAFSGKTVQSFVVLPSVAVSPAQTRSYNQSGTVVVVVNYSDHSSEVDQLTLPATGS